VVPDIDSIRDTVRRESSFALTLGGALFGAGLSSLFAASHGVPLVMLVACGLTGWTLSVSKDPARYLVAKIVAGTSASVVLSFTAAGLLDASLGALLAPILFLVSTLAVGFFLSHMAQVTRYMAAETHEDGALARLSGSRWLLAVALLSGVVAALTRDLSLGVVSIVVSLIAAVRWALARDALTTARQWIQHVRDEDAIGWRIIEAEEAEALEAKELRPLVRGAPMDGVLVQTPGGGSYREGAGSVAVALAPRGKWREKPPPLRLPGPNVASSLVAFFAFSAPTWVWQVIEALHLMGTGYGPFVIACVISAPLVVGASLITQDRKTVWLYGLLGCAVSAVGPLLAPAVS